MSVFTLIIIGYFGVNQSKSNPPDEDHVEAKSADISESTTPVADLSYAKKAAEMPEAQAKQVAFWPSEKEIKTWKSHEVEFYGKVVDLNDHPIANAYVNCIIATGDESKDERSVSIKTKEDGTFLLKEKNAPMLRLNVTADGYYHTDESRKSFQMAPSPASMPAVLRPPQTPNIQSSPENPVVFKLRAMGTREPLLFRQKAGVMKAQQTYMIGFKKEHSIEVRYGLDPQAKRIVNGPGGYPLYNWWVEIIVPQGGIKRTEKPNPEEPQSFVAPENGYEQKYRYEFTDAMVDESYRKRAGGDFFIRFNDNTYARIEIDLSSDIVRPFHSFDSWFNPSSRFTEPDATKYIEVPHGE